MVRDEGEAEVSEFGFTEAERSLQAQVRDFTNKEIRPKTKDLCTSQSLPYEIGLRLGEMGYLGMVVPEEYGGQGLDSFALGIVVEELAKGHLSVAERCIAPNAMYIMLSAADPDKIKDYYPAVARGEHLITTAITEPNCGTDPAAMAMTAVKDGDHYILNGEKVPITWAKQDYVKTIMTLAKTDPTQRARGVSAFVVPADVTGLTISDVPIMGWRANTSALLTFQDVHVPVQNLVGKEGQGFSTGMGLLTHNRILLGLMALGNARAVLDETINYVKQRSAFGKPIAKYEAISFKIAEDVSFLEMNRNFCYHALRMKDTGLDIAKESSICKWTAAKLGVKIVRDCMTMHGWFGYCEESLIPYRLADALGFEFADGTAEAQKMILTNSILGREYLPYTR